jgi:hypothetical protein
MKDLRVAEIEEKKKKLSKRIRLQRFLIYLKKNRWWILLFIFLFFIIVFPTESGQIIGTWINKFFITLIKYII